MSNKRHLPVIPSQSRDEGPNLTPLEWVLLGALCILVLFLPLGILGLWASSGLGALVHATGGHSAGGISSSWLGPLVATLPLLGSFAIAALGGSAVVGRYALRGTRGLPTYAGLLAAVLIVALAYVQGALRPPALLGIVLSILLILASIFSHWGGKIGRKYRA